MPQGKPYDSILLRDGTSQKQRQDTVLLQDHHALADERSLEDLVRLTKDYAETVRFFDFDGSTGNWKAFFQQLTEENLALLQSKNNFDPHIALYLSFLRLFAHAQADLNKFTRRHLDFYYRNVLGLSLQPGYADNVHLIFELSKTASEELLEKNTKFDAGKSNGLPLHYKLDDDVVINKVTVSDLRTVHLSPLQPNVIRMATVSNSADGLGGKLKPEAPFWDAFGLRHIPQTKANRSKVGFALASALFLLKEGRRTITLTLSLGNLTEDVNAAIRRLSLLPRFDVFYSGEKAWHSPGSDVGVQFGNYNPAAQTQDLVLSIVLDAAEPSVTAYQAKVHGGRYETEHPVIQVLTDTTLNGNLFAVLKNTRVLNCSARVNVTGITSLELESDQGVLNAQKPFQPFGAAPKKGSSFYVSYDELMQKKVTDFTFTVTWLDPPADFKKHYTGYETVISNNDFFKATYYLKDGTKGTTELFLDNAIGTINWPHASINFNWTLIQSRFVLPSYLSHHELFSNPNFGVSAFGKTALRHIRISSPAVTSPPTKGFIRFELQKSFLHDEFSRVYTGAVLRKSRNDDVVLPKEPYLPVIKSIAFSYSAEEVGSSPATASFSSYSRKKLQFFQQCSFCFRQKRFPFSLVQ